MSKMQIRLEANQLMLSFLERGGKVAVGRAGRRNATNSSWNGIRADVAYRGAKSKSLRMTGLCKAVG